MAVFGKELVLLYTIYLCIGQTQGVLVGESDLIVQEGSSREVFVRRSGSQPLNITIFATTIDDYRHLQPTASSHECGMTLSSLIVASESQVDPAEVHDLLARQYTLAYGTGEQEKSFTLEVTDDSVAENEEIFILYTNFMESPNDRCATAVRLQDNDVVKFNLSTANLSIREDEDLPSRLAIIKTGQIEHNINFQVYVYPGEGGPNENDFIANSDHVYMFTNETNELRIATEILDDLIAEFNKVIVICLPSLHEYTMAAAESVEPSCVSVTINDNDPMVIGFLNSTTSLELTEGRQSMNVCIGIKQGGFPLDLNGHLELTIQTESIEGEVEYGGERLEFDSTQFISCKTIVARDDRVSDGIHTSMLTIGMAPWSSVPVNMSNGRIPITVYDNDITTFDLIFNTDTSGGAVGSQASPRVQEGARVENLIRIRKRGYTMFAYNVLLSIESLTEPEDISFILNTTVRFGESTSEMDIVDIPITVLDDSVLEKQKEFSVSVLSIEPLDTDVSTGSKTGALIELGRESISITVFDNDFNVGFVNESVAVTHGGSLSICVAILEPKQPDIDPMQRIPILVSTVNTSADILELETNEIVLGAANTQVCVTANIQSQCENATNFMVELHWNSNPLYKVNFQRHNLSITCHQEGLATTGVCQSCIEDGGVNPRNPADDRTAITIVIPIAVVIVLMVIIVVIIITACLLSSRGIGKKPKRVPTQRSRHDTEDGEE